MTFAVDRSGMWVSLLLGKWGEEADTSLFQLQKSCSSLSY